MPTQKDIDNAKKAFDRAWAEATKYGNEAIAALRMAEAVPARDTDDALTHKARQATIAYENWRKAATLAADTLEEMYKRVLR